MRVGVLLVAGGLRLPRFARNDGVGGWMVFPEWSVLVLHGPGRGGRMGGNRLGRVVGREWNARFAEMLWIWVDADGCL